MPIYGSVAELAKNLAADPRFGPALRYLERCLAEGSADAERIRGLAVATVGEVRLDGGAVVFEQVYLSRHRKDCVFESHRKYIDVQFILEGEEDVDVTDTGGLIIERPYREEKDVVLYRDGGAVSRHRLRAGEAAIFFPDDAHMPGQAPGPSGLVRKAVIKVPVAPTP